MPLRQLGEIAVSAALLETIGSGLPIPPDLATELCTRLRGARAARMCVASFSLTSHHYQGLQNPILSAECQHQSGERGFIVGSAEIGEVLQPASDISDQVLVEADLAATS